jgi:hypothetical protein
MIRLQIISVTRQMAPGFVALIGLDSTVQRFVKKEMVLMDIIPVIRQLV